jgi:hypothetical protein
MLEIFFFWGGGGEAFTCMMDLSCLMLFGKRWLSASDLNVLLFKPWLACCLVLCYTGIVQR